MKWKLDEKGNPVIEDGKAVLVDESGKDVAVDPVQLHAQLKTTNDEAKKHRLNYKDASEQLAKFEGLDPDEARKALATVRNLDDKKLIDAGDAERVKAEMVKGYEEKLAAKDKELDTANGSIRTLLVSNAFGSSKVLEGTVLPSDIAEATFGKQFKVEQGADGQPVVVGYHGEAPIMSKSNPAAFANFDEALTSIIDAYPRKDEILRASGSGGSGSGGNSGTEPKPGATWTAKQKSELIKKRGPEAVLDIKKGA